MKSREWDLAWAAWLAGSVGSFAVLERLALRNARGQGGTFTAVSRRWLGLDPRKPWSLAGIAVVYVASGWVAGHLAHGKWDLS